MNGAKILAIVLIVADVKPWNSVPKANQRGGNGNESDSTVKRRT